MNANKERKVLIEAQKRLGGRIVTYDGRPNLALTERGLSDQLVTTYLTAECMSVDEPLTLAQCEAAVRRGELMRNRCVYCGATMYGTVVATACEQCAASVAAAEE